MRRTVDMDGRSMDFEATAMTDHMADAVFHINLSYAIQHAEGNEEKTPELVRKVAFIMNKRAELGGWRAVEQLTEDDYLDWLDSLDSYQIETYAKDIMTLYASNKQTAVHPKNTTSLPVE